MVTPTRALELGAPPPAVRRSRATGRGRDCPPRVVAPHEFELYQIKALGAIRLFCTAMVARIPAACSWVFVAPRRVVQRAESTGGGGGVVFILLAVCATDVGDTGETRGSSLGKFYENG